MSIEELSLLDGRYQLIRQLGGSPRAPLMVASDVLSGSVVCIRLRQFSTATASLAAVPALAVAPQRSGDGPLLPYDFGVDEGTAYVVRDFVTGISLQQLLAERQPLSPLAMISLLRRAGNVLLMATDQGFSLPAISLRHVLIAPDGTVRVAGYDHGQPASQLSVARDGEMLVALVQQAFDAVSNIDLSPPIRALLARLQARKGSSPPNLESVVRQLRRCEEQLLGYSRLHAALATIARVLAALNRRFRHLGPLLQPYLIVLTLVIAILIIAFHALTRPVSPGRILVYPVPAHASASIATNDPFANPPALTVAAMPAATTTSIIAAPAESTATTAEISAAPAERTTAVPTDGTAAAAERPVVQTLATLRIAVANTNGPSAASFSVVPPKSAPATAARTFQAAPQQAFHRAPVAVATRPAPARAAITRAAPTLAATTSIALAPADSRSTVIVTSLTMAATTARVTVIAATSDRNVVTATASTHSLRGDVLHAAMAPVAPANSATVRSTTTSTFSRTSALAAKAGS